MSIDNLKLSVQKGFEVDDVNSFDEYPDKFVLHTSSGTDLVVPLKFPLTLIDVNNYKCVLMFADSVPENAIMQVYDHYSKTRLGWIIPIQSLQSNEHDFVNNEHFLPYASAAFKHLLAGTVTVLGEPTLPLPDYRSLNPNLINLTNFYSDKSVLIVLNRNCIASIREFNLHNYLPWLHQRGIYANIPANFGVKFNVDTSVRLNIRGISCELRGNEFIKELFVNLLPSTENVLVKFHLLYQIVELLMERIFYDQIKMVFQELQTGSSNNSLNDLKEDFLDNAKEKTRIEKLFNDYTRNISNLSQLRSLCNALLSKIGKKQGSSVAQALYGVRNAIVHEFRNIPHDCKADLNDISACFELVIIDVLITYSVPNSKIKTADICMST